MIESDELKKLAEAAAPGKWEYSMTSSGFRKIKASDRLICGVSSFGCQDARYIAAANPATILALIARLDAVEAELARLRSQKPVAWIDAEGDIYKVEPGKNWCPPHIPLYASPVIAGPVADATLAELMAEQKRLDWALAHEAGFHGSTLSWSDSTGAIEMRVVPVGALRETIDVLMQEVG